MELDIQSKVSGVYESKDAESVVEVLGLGVHTETLERFLVCIDESDGSLFLKIDSEGLDRVSGLMETLLGEGIWRHYKSHSDKESNNHDYAILGEASDLESDESLVVYTALYEKTKDLEVDFWLRPKIDFYGEVNKEFYSGPRFFKVAG